MALVAVVEAGISNELAVGRDGRGVVWAFAVRELPDGSIGGGDLEDLCMKRFGFKIGGAVHGDDDRFAFGCPDSVGAAEFAGVGAVRKIAGGELARGAAVGGDDEDLGVAGLEVAGTVEAIDEVFVDFGRVGPLGAFGSGGHGGGFLKRGGGKGEEETVGAVQSSREGWR